MIHYSDSFEIADLREELLTYCRMDDDADGNTGDELIGYAEDAFAWLRGHGVRLHSENSRVFFACVKEYVLDAVDHRGGDSSITNKNTRLWSLADTLIRKAEAGEDWR